MICRLCRVRGRVQGVFFRGSAAAEARRLGITGYARNLPDGSVEVLACGPEAAVEQMLAWLAVGPVAAKVSSVQSQPVTPDPLPVGFTTG